MNDVLIAAHRGASGVVAHDNSLQALVAAGEAGAEWVEIDVRAIADGTLVVFHDPSVAGHPLRALSLRQLRRLAGYRVLTLSEALSYCRLHLCVDLEIKEPGTEQRVAEVARRCLDPGWYVYTSAHDDVLWEIKRLDPHTRTGLILGTVRPAQSWRDRLSEWWPESRARDCDANFVAANWRLIRFGFLRRMQRAELPVWAWTVNRRRVMAALMRAGVACLITDYPDRALEVLHQIREPNFVPPPPLPAQLQLHLDPVPQPSARRSGPTAC